MMASRAVLPHEFYAPTDSAQPTTAAGPPHHHQQRRLARVDAGTRRNTRAPARVLRFRPARFHNASAAPFTTGLITAAPDRQSASKAVRVDGRCLARTGDLLLVRRKQVLRSTAVCRSDRLVSDGPRQAAALCCGLPLPRRFHRVASPNSSPARIRLRSQWLVCPRDVRPPVCQEPFVPMFDRRVSF